MTRWCNGFDLVFKVVPPGAGIRHAPKGAMAENGFKAKQKRAFLLRSGFIGESSVPQLRHP
jgi:hypothetical protein